MNYRGNIVPVMQQLIQLFQGVCPETETLRELSSVLGDRSRWMNAHDLFQRIRAKTLKAEKSGNRSLKAQYLFEEVCAKTIYNISLSSAPFDPDSPFWVVPNAFSLASHYAIPQERVVARLLGPNE